MYELVSFSCNQKGAIVGPVTKITPYARFSGCLNQDFNKIYKIVRIQPLAGVISPIKKIL